MKVKKESIHTKDKKETEVGELVDLNGAKCQKRMLDYVKHGVKASDSKYGHSIVLQTKATPVLGDILEGIREKAPKGYWKSQSQQLRSVISLGAFVMSKILEKSETIEDLHEEFELLALINQINKRIRKDEVFIEAAKVSERPSAISVEFKEIIAKLKKQVED